MIRSSVVEVGQKNDGPYRKVSRFTRRGVIKYQQGYDSLFLTTIG